MSGGVVSGVNQFRHAVSDGDGSRAIAIVERQSANTRIICGSRESYN
ncbi:hypothetical protein [Segatella bryantii]|nr:hypothetical protein [Segatella bryantii]